MLSEHRLHIHLREYGQAKNGYDGCPPDRLRARLSYGAPPPSRIPASPVAPSSWRPGAVGPSGPRRAHGARRGPSPFLEAGSSLRPCPTACRPGPSREPPSHRHLRSREAVMPRVRSNDATIDYDDVGLGDPALLLLPGWCGTRAAFDPVIEPVEREPPRARARLARSRRVRSGARRLRRGGPRARRACRDRRQRLAVRGAGGAVARRLGRHRPAPPPGSSRARPRPRGLDRGRGPRPVPGDAGGSAPGRRPG